MYLQLARVLYFIILLFFFENVVRFWINKYQSITAKSFQICGGVINSVLISSAVDGGFKPQSRKT